MKTGYAFSTRLSGVGSAFPARRLSNDELSKTVETSNEWILERTGIRERRISDPTNEDECNSSLGFAASKRALEMAGKSADEIDLIIYATCTPDTLIPSTACFLQKKLGASKAAAFDVNAACSGFIFGLSVADQFIRTGQAKTILVVGADVLSTFTNWQDRTSCILFGDGAGAAILERTEANASQRILSTHIGSDGTLWDLFHLPAGGSKMETTPEVLAQNLHKMQMKGKEIFKSAVRTLADYAAKAIESNQINLSQVDWLVPHQANLRIIEAVAKRLNFPMEKVLVNIDRYGNTSSATVPSAFDEAVRDGRIKKGQIILFDVFGAGLTYGSVLLRW
ncbi:MAG: ketoacyl-ACP synthase III [Bdellovibrio sp.]|nr:ketoacyl-ACP synthase III [Bdellovibrio sp.]